MFKHPFSFTGRIRRTEYGISIIAAYVFYFIILVIIGIVIRLMRWDVLEYLNIINIIVYIPMLWFILAQGTKRCHDTGTSGWYQLIPLYNLYLLLADGHVGANGYGPDPKGRKSPMELMEQLNTIIKEPGGNEGEF